jgi:hypothetical protein
MTDQETQDREVQKYLKYWCPLWSKFSRLYRKDLYYSELVTLCDEISSRIEKGQPYQGYLLRLCNLQMGEKVRWFREREEGFTKRYQLESARKRGRIKYLREFVVLELLESLPSPKHPHKDAWRAREIRKRWGKIPRQISQQRLLRFNDRQLNNERDQILNRNEAAVLYADAIEIPSDKTIIRAIRAIDEIKSRAT